MQWIIDLVTVLGCTCTLIFRLERRLSGVKKLENLLDTRTRNEKLKPAELGF